MKKIINKVVLIGLLSLFLLQSNCFAISTIADGVLRNSRSMMKEAERAEPEKNYLPIIIGVIVAIVVVISVIIVVKNKKKKNTKIEKENNEV